MGATLKEVCMDRSWIGRALFIVGATIIPVALSATRQTNQQAERYVANAVNLGDVGRPGAGIVEMVVTRWSSNAEAERLVKVVMEKGADKLLDAVQDTPK